MKNQTKSTIRTRIAPSPTGPLHIGTARTALFNYLFAKQNKGEFILRIEDTDKERSKVKWVENIKQGLKWLGLTWDEEYKQSERTKIYKEYLGKLLKSKKAYWCYCTEDELNIERAEQQSRGESPKYSGKCRDLTKEEIAEFAKQKYEPVLRFKTKDQKIKFKDLIRGKLEFDTSLIGDFVIAKNLNKPLYNFANVIDDAKMKITHIIRGEDHISNTPKQILLYNALNLAMPKFAHLPLILGHDRSKISKRHGSVSIEDYKKQGYLPEAMINFMALFGWNPGQGSVQEIFSIKELIEKFTLQKVQKAGAVFDIEKLNWINKEYIKNMDLDELESQISKLKSQIYISNLKSHKKIKEILAIEQERMITLKQIGEGVKFFFTDKLNYDAKLLQWKDMAFPEVCEALETAHKTLFSIKEKDFTQKKQESKLLPLSAEWGKGDRGKLLWPLRVALTGEKNSPGPFEVAEILGKKKSLERIKKAIKKC